MIKRPGAALAKRISKARAIDGGEPRAVSVDEAAAMLRVGRSKIKELVRDKELLSFKMGRLLRIPINSIDDYIEKQMSR
jgi:excisionase family DNA binding protein